MTILESIAAATGTPSTEWELRVSPEETTLHHARLELVRFGTAVLRGEVDPTRIAAVKWEAGRRIEAAGFTAINQANWSRYATRLLRKQVNGGTLTADEEADAAFAEAGAQWIDAVRAASDAIEAIGGLSPFDPAAPWPAMPDPASYRACPKVFQP